MYNIGPSCDEYKLVRGNTFYGEFAHICAAEEGGERWVESMSDDDSNGEEKNRNGVQNIIVLCPNHHTIIDKKNSGYSIERLRQIKAQHEGQNTSPVQDISENVIENALSVANANITNIHYGSGVQQNNSVVGSTSPNSFNAARDVIYIAGEVPSPSASTTPAQVTPTFYEPERRLTLIAELTALITEGDSATPEDNPGAVYLSLTIDGKRFAVQHQQLVYQTTGVDTDGTGKFRMGAESVALIFKKARLYEDGRLQDYTLIDELRLLTREQSLNLIIETTDAAIRKIPFNKVDESSTQCSNPIKLIFREEQ